MLFNWSVLIQESDSTGELGGRSRRSESNHLSFQGAAALGTVHANCKWWWWGKRMWEGGRRKQTCHDYTILFESFQWLHVGGVAETIFCQRKSWCRVRLVCKVPVGTMMTMIMLLLHQHKLDKSSSSTWDPRRSKQHVWRGESRPLSEIL